MAMQESTVEPTTFDGRVKLGTALFVLSIASPLLGVPVVAALGLPATKIASISGALLVAGEVLGLVAVAVMGKTGYTYIKSCVVGFLRRHGPTREVSRLRYNIGLVMFSVPILFGWLSPYAIGLVPGLTRHPLVYAVGGDLLLLASLFVLGGDFWDKVRALFVYSDKVSPSNE
jgi:hypothetical protein